MVSFGNSNPDFFPFLGFSKYTSLIRKEKKIKIICTKTKKISFQSDLPTTLYHKFVSI